AGHPLFSLCDQVRRLQGKRCTKRRSGFILERAARVCQTVSPPRRLDALGTIIVPKPACRGGFMLAFNREKCLAEVSKADTTDLLDRITAYRRGLEPEAADLIEQE